MKTKLLYLASVMLVLFTACSVEENHQLSEQEKNLKVKSLVRTFAEDVMPSPSYNQFINNIQEKSSSGLTQEELEQEFLSQQSPEFVELYNLVVDMNLSKDELRLIVMEYFDDLKSENNYKTDGDDEGSSNNGDCSAASGGQGSSLLAFLSDLICEVIKS